MLARDAESALKHTPLHGAPCRPWRPDGAVRRLCHAGAICRWRAQGASAYPHGRGPVRRLAYGPDRAAPEIRPDRGCRAGTGTAGAAGYRGARPGPAALRPVHHRQRRHSRRPDGGEFRQPSVPGGQRRLQGCGRGASARRPVGCLRDRAARRPRADRAAGTQRRIGAGEILCRGARDAVHGCGTPPRQRHRLFRLALRLYRRGRL